MVRPTITFLLDFFVKNRFYANLRLVELEEISITRKE